MLRLDSVIYERILFLSEEVLCNLSVAKEIVEIVICDFGAFSSKPKENNCFDPNAVVLKVVRRKKNANTSAQKSANFKWCKRMPKSIVASKLQPGDSFPTTFDWQKLKFLEGRLRSSGRGK